jgi:squalene-hopene/tetraprenyl-beta-curcumene cyclase
VPEKRSTPDPRSSIDRANHWIAKQVGSLDPEDIANAVVARYGKDKTFSVPILMLCSICGTLGEEGWKRVLPLPFELAAFPRTWFGAIGLPVVSYALPALIAIGYTRFFHAPPAKWIPRRWLRAALWHRISPMLKTLQPSSGGYLEATPLTSFVTMALASADEKHHPCVPVSVGFLLRSQREDGSWPIDTNLATWGTTLSVKALSWSAGFSLSERKPISEWLVNQQYREVHPFTNAAPGGWAWTDLPGGVPDADDTSGALIALWHLCDLADERRAILPQIEAGITWLLDLQNRDGGMPTFCRGWGALPFDRSTPGITAHTLWAFAKWRDLVNAPLHDRMSAAIAHALQYLRRAQRLDGSWHPLWFGNEHTHDEENPVHGTAMVVQGLSHFPGIDSAAGLMLRKAVVFLLDSQHTGGGWGGSISTVASVEETANATNAVSGWLACETDSTDLAIRARESIARGAVWLLEHTQNGTNFPAAPIGLYFARLWYHEHLYPVIWTLAALQQAATALTSNPERESPRP